MKQRAFHLLIFVLTLLFCSYSVIPTIASVEDSSFTTCKNVEDAQYTSFKPFQKVIFIVRDDDTRIILSLKNIFSHFATTYRFIPIKVETACRELLMQSSILLDRSYAFHLLGVLKSRAHPPTF